MKEKMKKTLLSLFMIIIIINIFFVIIKIAEPASVALIKDEKTIKKIIDKKYPLHQIKDMELEYIDWFSCVRNADKDNKATMATVIIRNESEQRTINFQKKYFIWTISSNLPDYGPNIPNGLYLVEKEHKVVGNAVDDIDDHMKKYWVIPDDNGNYYSKVGNDENWYYSFWHCKNIYKTKDGIIYIFNKEKASWEVATQIYSEIYNYEKVDMKYAMEIIEKYTSYKEY